MNLSNVTWKRNLANNSFPKHKASKPSLDLILNHVGFGIRHFIYSIKERWKRKAPTMEIFAKNIGPYAGVPIGGIGSGSINRGWRGEFARWQLNPSGIRDWDVINIDGFSLRVVDYDDSEEPRASFLHPQTPSRCSPMYSWYSYPWDWDKATYYGLFPQAWTIYDLNPIDPIVVTCHQFSPVIPHNYKESTYPISMFVYNLENTSTDKTYEVSLMFTFANSVGKNNKTYNSVNTPYFDRDIMGIRLDHQVKRTLRKDNGEDSEYFDPATLGIALERGNRLVKKSYCTSFDASDRDHCQRLFQDFKNMGRITDFDIKEHYDQLATALAVTVKLGPGEKIEIPFSLAWYIPVVRFGTGHEFYRMYTSYFDRNNDVIFDILKLGLSNWRKWVSEINQSQAHIVNSNYPDWLKCALINELYYLVDGGTVWLQKNDKEYFGYLEGVEYLMYNTYDVHFYACFALLENWPYFNELIQKSFIDEFYTEDGQEVSIIATGKRTLRKKKYTIPHDLGNPAENPFFQINAYRQQDTSKWKDLGPKFILQIYLTYLYHPSIEILEESWPIVQKITFNLLNYDQDDDGLIENDGTPDTTYDAWVATGPSAYTAGLFLASLQATIQIANILGKDFSYFTEVLEIGLKSFQEKLWNESYYMYDVAHPNVIMSDQLCGHFYSKFMGLGGIVSDDCAQIALQTIHNFNLRKFENGDLGVVNGMKSDGTVDTSSLQSSEVWPGTNFILAATMFQTDLTEEAFEILYKVLRASYETFGYQFQTPEAWDKKGHYRACTYMRPLSIWAVHAQLTHKL